MKIYHYDSNTGELVGEADARIAPLREDLADTDETKFLCPANATFIAPLDPVVGSVPAFRDGAWTQVVDHRGETWFKAYGQPVTIESIGDVPEGLSKIEPPAPPAPPPLTPQEKLAAAGLTVAELKTLLGL